MGTMEAMALARSVKAARWPVWKTKGWSSSMRYWLKVKPVGPMSGTKVDSR